MSKIQVDTIDTRSGTSTMQIGSTNTTTITLGVSGDTINVPSGVTIANAGTATGFGELNSPAFNVFQSSSTSISNASYTVLSLDGNTYNPDSKFASNKFTPGVSGLYYLEAKIRYDSASTFSTMQVVIRKNGSALVRGTNNNTSYSTVTVSTLIQSDTDDYFDVEAYQNSGGSLNLLNNAESTYFHGFKVISI